MNLLKQSKLVGLRIPNDLYEKLEALAKKENRSLSNLIKTILSQQLEATEYLTSSPKNKARLNESLKQAKKDKIKPVDESELLEEQVKKVKKLQAKIRAVTKGVKIPNNIEL